MISDSQFQSLNFKVSKVALGNEQSEIQGKKTFGSCWLSNSKESPDSQASQDYTKPWVTLLPHKANNTSDYTLFALGCSCYAILPIAGYFLI